MGIVIKRGQMTNIKGKNRGKRGKILIIIWKYLTNYFLLPKLELRIFFVIQCCLVYLIHKVSITTFLLFSQYLVMLYREQPTICIINLICIESKNERKKYMYKIHSPTKTLRTFGEAYSSISLNHSGQQSNVGWLDTS